MPNIKPVSDLKNYDKVLSDITVGDPVFLTENGRGRYVIVDIAEYEKQNAILKLMSELAKGEEDILNGNLYTVEDLDREFGL